MKGIPITFLTKRHDPIAIVKRAVMIASEEILNLATSTNSAQMLNMIEAETKALVPFLQYLHAANDATGQITPPYDPGFDTQLSNLRAAGLSKTADFMHKWTSYRSRNNLMKDGLLIHFFPTEKVQPKKKTTKATPASGNTKSTRSQTKV